MKGFGGMITIYLDSDLAALAVSWKYLTICAGESLGGVESLIEHPALMTSRIDSSGTADPTWDRDSLIRLSVGVEDVEDLRSDLAEGVGPYLRGRARSRSALSDTSNFKHSCLCL